MIDDVENLVLEHLKKIQGEQSASRDRDREIITRLGQLGSAVARIGRDNAHAFAEQVEDRHALDAVKIRLERIERRLEIGD